MIVQTLNLYSRVELPDSPPNYNQVKFAPRLCSGRRYDSIDRMDIGAEATAS